MQVTVCQRVLLSISKNCIPLIGSFVVAMLTILWSMLNAGIITLTEIVVMTTTVLYAVQILIETGESTVPQT